MPKTRHRISGVIENDTPQHIIDHEVLGKHLEIIEDDDKALVPELVSLKHAEEIAAKSRQVDSDKNADDADNEDKDDD